MFDEPSFKFLHSLSIFFFLRFTFQGRFYCSFHMILSRDYQCNYLFIFYIFKFLHMKNNLDNFIIDNLTYTSSLFQIVFPKTT